MSSFLQDLRFGARTIRQSPGFAAAAVLSLALGIGATTAVFSVTSALLLTPLPYPDADRLVILWNRSPGLNITEDWFSKAQYYDILRGHSGFEELGIAIGANFTVTGDGEPERVGTISLSANVLPLLGATPHAGQLFTPDDNVASPPPTQNQPVGRVGKAVLSYGTWARRYGGDRAVVGRTLTLNGQPYEIVGVLPQSFSLPREVMPTLGVVADGEVYLPLPLAASDANVRTAEDYNIVGRLKRGVTIDQAQAEMDGITARLRRDFPAVYPPNGGLTFSIVPLLEQVVGNVRRPLVILFVSVACVLLIACANVANLLLARALAREREMSVRVALGAGRGRLVRQLLTESVLLGVAGGALGILLAVLSVRWLHAFQPADVPRLGDIAVNLPVLAFTVAISIGAGILFGLAPALGMLRGSAAPLATLNARGTSGTGAVWSRGHRLRRLLVVAELALAVILLIGAGLLIRSFARVQQIAPGFNPANIVSFELTMPPRKYPNADAVINAYRSVWDKLAVVPGVTSAGGATTLPLSQFFAWGPITIDGRTPAPGEGFINADQRTATAKYFETMGIPLVKGRYFTEADTRDQPRVVIIDHHLARTLFPGEEPLGRRLKFGDASSQSPWETIVGVVGDVKQYALDADSRIALYRPHTQSPSRSLYVVLKSERDAAALTPNVVSAIRAHDPDVPVYRVRTMTQRVDESLARRRFSMTLLSAFATLALVLAAVGIYGVMAYLVRQGAREVGIRIALGATPRAIVGLVIRQGLIVTLAGLAIGLAGAWALTRVMRSLLFEVEATDPLTFAAIAVLLGATAIAACYLPPRRAARIDPLVSLRAE
jgi:predicted permease